MSWKLDSLQRIETDHDRNVYFKDSTGNVRREFALSYRHFQSLHHIMKDLKYFYMKRHSRIGNRIWLRVNNRRIQLYHSQLHTNFTFHQGSWEKYKRKVHRSIYSFFHHEAPSLHHRQHSPSLQTLHQNRSHNITPTPSKQQVLPGPTSNVSGEDEQFTESSTLPKWDCTDSRRPFSFIGAVNALRATKTTTSDMEEGEVCDVESDCGQYGDLYSIE
jgi:hypothetical protein